MKRTPYEIQLLMLRQFLKDSLKELKTEQCPSLYRYKSLTNHFIRVNIELRNYRRFKLFNIV
jgi:hypothetical protein